MFSVLKSRFIQGYRTGKFPYAEPVLPERFMGRPEIDQNKCGGAVREELIKSCPSDAIAACGDGVCIDLGKCIFCGKCREISDGITFSRTWNTAAMKRESLVVDGSAEYEPDEDRDSFISSLCGRSFKIRQVSAGGCAACELDFNVLNTLAWDMGRFGIQVVASPRHADCILVTGPVTENMALALKKTFEAVPEPAFVILCGACAISGGIYAGSPETRSGAAGILKPDLYIPGCPPHPTAILEGILRLTRGAWKKKN